MKEDIADRRRLEEEIQERVTKYEGKKKRAAIAKYMFEHPEETRKSIIGQAINVNRQTVAKYYDEIREEIDELMFRREPNLMCP